MNECPACGETLDLSGDDRGGRGHGTTIVMVEMGRDVNLIAHCRHCHETLSLWAEVVDGSVEQL